MSTAARLEEERWLLPLAVTVVVALVVSIALVKLGPSRPGDAGTQKRGTAISIAAANQVPWKTTTALVGTLGPVKPAEKAMLERQSPRVMDTVAKTYKALFLEPTRLRDVLSMTFAPRAAAGLRRADLKLPPGTRDVRFFKRIAHVGIGAAGTKAAAVEVLVKLRAHTSKARVRLVHRAHLWLERTSSGWKVIAFDVDQVPIR